MLFLRKLCWLEAGQFAQFSLKYTALQRRVLVQDFLVTDGFQVRFSNAINTGEESSYEHRYEQQKTPLSRTYTMNDIAEIFGIEPDTAYKLTNYKSFNVICIVNMIRISRKFFEDWLKIEMLDEKIK